MTLHHTITIFTPAEGVLNFKCTIDCVKAFCINNFLREETFDFWFYWTKPDACWITKFTVNWFECELEKKSYFRFWGGKKPLQKETK